MAKFVVQVFKAIDINHDYRHTCFEPACAFDFFDNAQFETTAIEDTCQPIEIGQLFHFFNVVRVLNGGGADVGHRLERLYVSPIEGPCGAAIENKQSQRLPKRNQGNAHGGA